MRISDWSSDVCSSDLLGRRRHRDFRRGLQLGEDRGGAALDRGFGRHARERRAHSLHALAKGRGDRGGVERRRRRFEQRLRSFGRSEEHTSELQSLMRISYAVFCLKKKKQQDIENLITQETGEQVY